MSAAVKSPWNRYRTRGGMLPNGSNTTEIYSLWGQTDYVDNFVAPTVGETETMVDVVTPAFSAVSSEGGIVNSPMKKVKETRMVSYGSCTRTYTASPPPYPTGAVWKAVRNFNRWGPLCQTPEIDIERLKLLAATKALANESAGDAAIGVGLGELPETIAMLKNPLQGVLRLLRSPDQPSLRKRVKEFAGGASSIHLQIIFGVMPIIQDLQNVLGILQKERPQRQTYRGSADDQADLQYTWQYSAGGATGQVSGNSTRIVSVRAGALVEWEVDSMLQRLGLMNPIYTAYQLYPFSFVVDWFVNLGSFISQLTPAFGAKSLAEWLVVKDFVVWNETLGALSSTQSGWSATGGGDSWVRTLLTEERTPVKLKAYSGIALKGKPLNAFQIAATISLITQALTKAGRGAPPTPNRLSPIRL